MRVVDNVSTRGGGKHETMFIRTRIYASKWSFFLHFREH